uniref:A-kinase anchor protein 12 isoform X2 n=1 Tax=Geotrypetes seraphini TaxID=260995 RepID=A0A6P8QXM9_GEOSA|nr:A-kinase anchor protein 12 isoform X2 [Geotrypetes seraphini]
MMGTITITVERDPENVTQKEESAGNMEVVPPEETDKGHVENGQKEAEETNEEMPMLEEKVEDLEETSEPQSNEVGFKKVFKFVGFKFTMKKEKTEKSEPVQLLTVKKDEVEANGTHEHEVVSDMTEEAKLDEDMTDLSDKTDKAPQSKESPTDLLPEKTDEATNEQAEAADVAEQKEPSKSPESPTNPIVSETSSSFKKFFTQGWAGLRKKTSFKKSKEEEHQASMKNEKEEQEEKNEMADILVEAVEEKEVVVEKERPSDEESLSQEAPESLTKDSISLNVDIIENMEMFTKEKLEQAEEEKLDQDEERKVSPAMMTETSAGTLEKKETEILVSTVEVSEKDQMAAFKLEVGSLNFEQSSEVIPKLQEAESSNELADTKELSDPVTEGQIQQTESSPEYASAHKTLEGIPSEADLLSAQEKIKLQGSPLKKLFTGSGLKRLSGKKQKGKKDEDSKVEEAAEHLYPSPESSEGQAADKGDSSPSSPEESTEVEKALADEAQIAETEGEGTTSDGERKKDGITTWASFKKLVTPKKRVKRPSESDKEDEPEKPKSATMSSTDSAASVENQEENKANGEEQKPEKSAEETKRKVDSSVSWEALICVGSSKKRGKKSSESDEEEAQKPLEESQKIDDEAIKSKEVEAPLTSGQDINQAQGSSSSEQAGSPESEGVSTWESFKRLVTPRKKSKTKMEEKSEESAAVLNAEHSTSDGEPGKEESWVSLKKLIPGRKKKKSDGKQEYASAEKVVEEAAGAEAAEEDSDVPAVVPLSEYEAAEQEKIEALQAVDVTIKREIAAQDHAAKEDNEESSEGLMHAVTVTLVEGARAVTSIEERSPSWISATVTESIEQANECEEIQQSSFPIETKIIVEETIVVTKTVPQTTKEVSEDLLTSEMEITHEAITALEEAAEMSCAEETTEMVSAVSQLSESPDTNEDTTPVQEAEENQKSLEDLKKETQEILQEVAEKVRLSEEAGLETEVKDEQSKEVIIVQSPVFIESFEQKEAKEAAIGKVECSSRSTEGIKEVEESIGEGESKMIFETYCVTERCVPEVGNYEVNHEGIILCEKQNDLHEEIIKHQSSGEEEREEIVKVEKKKEVKEKNLHSIATVTLTTESQPEVKVDIETVKQKQKTAAQHQPKVNDVAQSEITDDDSLEVGSESASVVYEAKSEFTQDPSELAASLFSLKSKIIEEAQDKVAVKTETIQEQALLVCSIEDGFVEKSLEKTCQQGKRTDKLGPLLEAAKLMAENSRTKEVIKQEPVEPVKSLQELKLAQKENDCEETSAVPQCARTIKEGKVEEEPYHSPEDQTIFLDVQQETESVTVLKEQVIRKSKINENLCDYKINEFKGDAYLVAVEEVTDGLGDANVTDIPKIESKEARRASIPVTAAAIEEHVVAETVALIQTCMETVKMVDVDENFAVDQAAESTEPVIESMSQTAAAIVDAAIEAAAIGLSDVELASNILGQKRKESAEKAAGLQEERKQSQVDEEMQKNESCFTVAQKIVQTTVTIEEKTRETIHTDRSSVSHDIKTTVAQVPEFQETLQMDELAVVKCAEEILAGEEGDVHQSNAMNYIVVEKVSEEQSSIEHTKDKAISDISEEIGVTFQEQKCMPQAQVGEQVHEDVLQLTKDVGDAPKREQEEPLQREAKSNLVSEPNMETQTEEMTSEKRADRRDVVDTGVSKERSGEFQVLIEENLKDVDQVVIIQEKLSRQAEERKQMLSETEAKLDVLHKVHSQEDESLERTKEQSQSTES